MEPSPVRQSSQDGRERSSGGPTRVSETRLEGYEIAGDMEPAVRTEEQNVLSIEELANLAAEAGQSAATLMNVVALIAKRFRTDVCSAYLLEPDRANLVLAATVGLRRECIGNL